MSSRSNEGILCLHGAIVMFAAFVSGGMIGAAALGQVSGDVEGWKLAHMEPLINSILLFAIAGVIGKLALSPGQAKVVGSMVSPEMKPPRDSLRRLHLSDYPRQNQSKRVLLVKCLKLVYLLQGIFRGPVFKVKIFSFFREKASNFCESGTLKRLTIAGINSRILNK